MLERLTQLDTEELCRRVEAEFAEVNTEVAPFMWRHAPDLCKEGGDGPRTCGPYHRVWSYLNLFGIIVSIKTDSRFLMSTFRDVLREAGSTKVLVSGAGDFGMLSHLLHAQSAEAGEFDITVLDRCATPLAVNRWYADRKGINIDTVQCNILDYETDQRFDLICTHAFIQYFNLEQKRRLTRRWHDLLKPGGKVVTVLSTRVPASGEMTERVTEEEAQAHRERILLEVERMAYPSAPPAQEIADTYYDYLKLRVHNSTLDEDFMREYFAHGGLDVIHAGSPNAAEMQIHTGTGGYRTPAGRLQVIAQRPK